MTRRTGGDSRSAPLAGGDVNAVALERVLLGQHFFEFLSPAVGNLPAIAAERIRLHSTFACAMGFSLLWQQAFLIPGGDAPAFRQHHSDILRRAARLHTGR